MLEHVYNPLNNLYVRLFLILIALAYFIFRFQLITQILSWLGRKKSNRIYDDIFEKEKMQMIEKELDKNKSDSEKKNL